MGEPAMPAGRLGLGFIIGGPVQVIDGFWQSKLIMHETVIMIKTSRRFISSEIYGEFSPNLMPFKYRFDMALEIR